MAAQSLADTNKIDIGLQIRNQNYTERFPEYSKPHPIGFFSVNAEGHFEPSDEELRYFRSPTKFPLNLNISLNKAIKKPYNSFDDALGNLLKFIFHHATNIFSYKMEQKPPEFITSCDVLCLIMRTPYEFKNDWCLHVTYFNNVYYMRENELPENLYKKQNQEELHKITSAWLYKFKQYCMWVTPFNEPDVTRPADECAEFSCVFRTHLAGINILFGSKVDGIVSNSPLNLNYFKPNLANIQFVKLKLRQNILNKEEKEIYLQNAIRDFWCQAFLTGIQTLIIGVRDDKGFVQNIEHINASMLPKMEGQKFWLPINCMSFLLSFLLRLKKMIGKKNCPHSVHQFHFSAKENRIYYKYFHKVTKHSFIPDWYESLISNLTKNH